MTISPSSSSYVALSFIAPLPVSYISKISSLVEIMSALVGKSGAGMNFKRSFVESFGESNKAIVASITSIEL